MQHSLLVIIMKQYDEQHPLSRLLLNIDYEHLFSHHKLFGSYDKNLRAFLIKALMHPIVYSLHIS